MVSRGPRNKLEGIKPKSELVHEVYYRQTCLDFFKLGEQIEADATTVWCRIATFHNGVGTGRRAAGGSGTGAPGGLASLRPTSSRKLGPRVQENKTVILIVT